MYDALMKGYQGVVLSDETAIGRDPVESCRAAALFRTVGWSARDRPESSANRLESPVPRRPDDCWGKDADLGRR